MMRPLTRLAVSELDHRDPDSNGHGLTQACRRQFDSGWTLRLDNDIPVTQHAGMRQSDSAGRTVPRFYPNPTMTRNMSHVTALPLTRK